MGNIHEDTNNSCSYEDRTLDESLYKDFMLNPSNGLSVDQKQMIRRTMLEQEAIFKEQLRELHRLHAIQLDLTHELEMKELHKSSAPMNPPVSSFSSSQMSSEVIEKTRHMPQLTTGNTNYNRASASTNGTSSPLDFLKENGMCSTQSIRPSLPNEELLNSQLEEFRQNMGDLQLPAKVFIDNDVERTEMKNGASSSSRVTESFNMNHSLEPERNVKLTSCIGENRICRKESWKLNSHPSNGMPTQNLADLDEPLKNVFREGEIGAVTTKCHNVGSHHEGMQGHQPLSAARRLHRDSFTNIKPCSKLFSEKNEETRQELKLSHPGVGQTRRDAKPFNPDSSKLSLSRFSQSAQPKHLGAHEIMLPHQNKTNNMFGGRKGIEMFGSSTHRVNSNDSTPRVQLSNPFEFLPRYDHPSTASSFLPWINPIKSKTHVPITGQSLPSFNGSSAINPQINGSGSNVQSLGNIFGPEVYSAQNGFHYGFPSDSSFPRDLQLPRSTFHISNLNSHGVESLHGNSKRHASSIGTSMNSLHGNSKERVSSIGTSSNSLRGNASSIGMSSNSLRGNASSIGMSSNSLHWNSKGHVSSIGTSSNGALNRRKFESGFSLDGSLEINKKQEREKGPSPWFQQDFLSSSNSQGKRIQRSKPSDDLQVSIFDKLQQISTWDFHAPQLEGWNSAVQGVRNGSTGFGNHIDLNSVASSCFDIRKFSEKPLDPETLVRIAADNLIAMSLDLRGHSLDFTCLPPNPDSYDPLQWLAVIASSETETPKAPYVEASDDDGSGLDYFESMTLKIKETKSDENWNRPVELGNRNGGEMGSASLLLTKLRKVQGRKRRQRRDFQKDVLPSIASLSRNEVAEDLQVLSALMKGLDGSNRRFSARGRRRTRNLAITVGENPEPTQALKAEPRLDGRSTAGCALTTRRGRRIRVSTR